MTSQRDHLIGLLLGAEEDWPTAFESLVRRLGIIRTTDGTSHRITSERVTIEPFNLRDKARQDLCIDRLAYWYYHPREWLKKAALMDDVYLLNSPFTFQSMEKHSAYCAMLRLGLNVPNTVLVPYKNPVDNARWAYTSAKYNQSFDLDALADEMGYPLYMKPFDGGGWRGVAGCARRRNRGSGWRSRLPLSGFERSRSAQRRRGDQPPSRRPREFTRHPSFASNDH